MEIEAISAALRKRCDALIVNVRGISVRASISCMGINLVRIITHASFLQLVTGRLSSSGAVLLDQASMGQLVTG
ncbi:unnamed protein product [Linum trigynum]|uniref:STAS domain-containing protein n=1 Tax=Linum trigynum TaxID=586398 RepID=A0AAV2E1H5_9ROSI